MRIRDWSSDVCSSDLDGAGFLLSPHERAQGASVPLDHLDGGQTRPLEPLYGGVVADEGRVDEQDRAAGPEVAGCFVAELVEHFATIQTRLPGPRGPPDTGRAPLRERACQSGEN